MRGRVGPVAGREKGGRYARAADKRHASGPEGRAERKILISTDLGYTSARKYLVSSPVLHRLSRLMQTGVQINLGREQIAIGG